MTRELGAIPGHVRKLFGWELIAWHIAEWWRFQWEVTELVTVTSVRLQHGWRDRLPWQGAVAERTGDRAGMPSNQAVIDLLTTDGGEFLGLAMVTAQKNGAARDCGARQPIDGGG